MATLLLPPDLASLPVLPSRRSLLTQRLAQLEAEQAVASEPRRSALTARIAATRAELVGLNAITIRTTGDQ